jgi:chromosomal replication initiation ATPase DnaA
MPLFHSTNRSLDNYNIEDYLFADSSLKQKLMKIAQVRMANLDTLIVLSTEGNGGTMLLCSTLKLMVEELPSQFIFFTGDHYSELAQMPMDEFNHLCEPYQFVVFDNIEHGCSKPNQYLWLEKIFESLRNSGKKTLATYTVMEEANMKVPDFIQVSALEVVYSLSEPSLYPNLVRNIFEKQNFENVTEELICRIASNTKLSVRELESLCINQMATETLAGREKQHAQ